MFTDPVEADCQALLDRAERYKSLARRIGDVRTSEVLLEMAQEYADMVQRRRSSAGSNGGN